MVDEWTNKWKREKVPLANHVQCYGLRRKFVIINVVKYTAQAGISACLNKFVFPPVALLLMRSSLQHRNKFFHKNGFVNSVIWAVHGSGEVTNKLLGKVFCRAWSALWRSWKGLPLTTLEIEPCPLRRLFAQFDAEFVFLEHCLLTVLAELKKYTKTTGERPSQNILYLSWNVKWAK